MIVPATAPRYVMPRGSPAAWRPRVASGNRPPSLGPDVVYETTVVESREQLQELLGVQDASPLEAGARAERATADWLLFDVGDATFALEAQQVEEVIAWRSPLPLPRADARVMGIIQDRGRIVVVLAPPRGREKETPHRMIICRTHRGYLGLPAGKTRCVASVKLYSELLPNTVMDTSEGVVTFLDSAALVAAAG